MLSGLLQGQEKMSKSVEGSAIFMEDDAATVKRKIKKAYCPETVVEGNPVLNWVEHIIFAAPGATLFVQRSDEEGGPIEYTSFAQLQDEFAAGKLHPSVLKPALSTKLNLLLEPVRKHFASGRPKELLKRVKQ